MIAKEKYAFLLICPHLLFPSFPYSFFHRCFFPLGMCAPTFYMLLCLSASKRGRPHGMSSFTVFEPLFLTPLEHCPSLPTLLDHSALPWEMAFSEPLFCSSSLLLFFLPLCHPRNLRFYVPFEGLRMCLK